MASLSDQDIEQIAQKIVANIGRAPAGSKAPSPAPAPAADPGLGIHHSIDEAATASREAFRQLSALPLKTRNRMIASIRETSMENASALARAAYDETGLGRYEDKIVKNQLVAEKTAGTEVLAPQSFTGDHGLTLIEPAPYGVIGSITPCTNPTSTIINNTIAMVAAGNSVVFNPHPAAKNCSMQTIAVLNKAIHEAGGPPNVVTCITNPTQESATEMMGHPGIRLLV
ncbi:MAG: aldehyde dehydrogenase family protein, partial [Verrucomicrobiota bacterium]